MAGEAERRLGAIMFTDVVGYSAIASADEARALRLLEEHRAALRPSIKRHHGSEVKTIGDAFLVEFASAVEAVNCAVEMQDVMREFNGSKPKSEQVSVRIGIHVGDVVHSEGDVLGDAVNVAARLQSVAEPGGICVTRQVVDQVERKVQRRFVKLGSRDLKNIGYPVELYKVEMEREDKGTGGAELDPRRIAILPFTNLSSDPNDRYFADGMTEELISTVSSISELSVISRTSIMRYKDTTVPIGDIGRELSAGTVLEGSVRKAGNKVRVTTQLIDSKNDRHLWAQSYDRDVTDIFAIQGDIAGQVAEALRVKLVSKEKEAIEKKATGNLEAYTQYLKGRYHWNNRSKEGLRKAVELFEGAVKMDPGFALAYSGLADAYLVLSDRGWISYSEAEPLAKGYAQKAVELDGSLAEAHASLGLALHEGWDFMRSEKEFKQSIALKPNYALAYHWYWGLLLDLGRFEEGYEIERHALELDPYSSVVRQGVGIAHLYLGRYAEAIAAFDAVIESDPDFASAYFWKAWAFERQGKLQEAIDVVRKGMAVSGESGPGSKAQLAWLSLRSGQKEPADKLLQELLSPGSYVSPTFIAIVKFGQGKWDEAYDMLERAFVEHDGALVYFRSFPWFAEYRGDKRWGEIERKMGLVAPSAR